MLLWAAAEHGDAEELVLALGMGADVSSTESQLQRSALHMAAIAGHSGVVELLVNVGVNLNAPVGVGMLCK